MADKRECPNKIWLRRIDDKKRQVIHVAPPCNRKSCKFCGNEMRKAHFKRIAYVMTHRTDWQWFFIATTGKSWWHKVDDKAGISLVQIRKTWAKWRKRLARKASPNPVLYFRVYEQHESGVYHLHAIIGVKNDFWSSSGIGEYKTVKNPVKRKQKRKYSVTKARIKTDRRMRWVRQSWRECGGGYQIHIKQIFVNENATIHIKYVIKYILKSSTETSRLGEYSRNFPTIGRHEQTDEDGNIIEKTRYQWTILGAKPDEIELRLWHELGYSVVGV